MNQDFWNGFEKQAGFAQAATGMFNKAKGAVSGAAKAVSNRVNYTLKGGQKEPGRIQKALKTDLPVRNARIEQNRGLGDKLRSTDTPGSSQLRDRSRDSKFINTRGSTFKAENSPLGGLQRAFDGPPVRR